MLRDFRTCRSPPRRRSPMTKPALAPASPLASSIAAHTLWPSGLRVNGREEGDGACARAGAPQAVRSSKLRHFAIRMVNLCVSQSAAGVVTGNGSQEILSAQAILVDSHTYGRVHAQFLERGDFAAILDAAGGDHGVLSGTRAAGETIRDSRRSSCLRDRRRCRGTRRRMARACAITSSARSFSPRRQP